MKEIKLTQGYVALVDDEDYERLSQFSWHVNKNGNTNYANRTTSRKFGRQRQIGMHMEVMNGKGIDHIDGNGLNNQKSNLRFCTSQQNQMNQKKIKNTSSIYKGVCWNKRINKWHCQIKINGKMQYLGSHINEVDAAMAYDNRAKELFGEFARLNII